MDSLTDSVEPTLQPADYRVRIFLSVDLSGSTAYKISQGAHIPDGEPTPKWVRAFQHFYSDFPDRYKTNYAQYAGAVDIKSCPVVWKAVGDELVFCGRVDSKRAVAQAVLCFINTMHDYRKHLYSETPELDVKGAAWLAAFPEPNRAVRVRTDASGNSWTSASEDLERAADASPYDYDFLGKAIDTGFRVAHLSTPEKFVLSVQLARLISQLPDGSGFDYSIRLESPVALKGVNNGIPYPFVFIDSMEHLAAKSVRLKERELLTSSAAPSKQALREYLGDYCRLAGTDEICLPELAGSGPVPPPEGYQQLRPLIEEHFRQEAERGAERFSAPPPATDETIDYVEIKDDLNPLL